MSIKLIGPGAAGTLEAFKKDPQSWMSSKMVVESLPWPVSSRTVRHFLLEFSQAGLLERMESFPGYLYRLRPGYERHKLYQQIQVMSAVMQQLKVGIEYVMGVRA